MLAYLPQISFSNADLTAVSIAVTSLSIIVQVIVIFRRRE
jgi:hypothetical protein